MLQVVAHVYFTTVFGAKFGRLSTCQVATNSGIGAGATKFANFRSIALLVRVYKHCDNDVYTNGVLRISDVFGV